MCGPSDTAHLCQFGTDTLFRTPLWLPLGTAIVGSMATDRTGTRVNLTLSDEVIRVLDRIGKVTGTGRATMIREILDEAAPQLAEMARALEDAQRGNVDAALRSIGATAREVSEKGQQLDLEIKRDRRRAMRKKIK